MEGKRLYWPDSLCGLLILHMIFIVHVAPRVGFRPEWLPPLSSALNFFMTWFFFKAGMFHKDGDTAVFIRKSFRRLMVPYLVCLLAGHLIDTAVFLYRHGGLSLSFYRSEAAFLLKHSVFGPTAPIWFLPALFFARVSFQGLYKRIHPLLMATGALCLAYGLHRLQAFVPYYVGSMFHGLFVYCAGYLLREKQFHKAVAGAALVIYIAHFFLPPTIDFKTNELSPYLPAAIYGLAGSILFNNIFSRWFLRRMPVLTRIGENSMIHYLVHHPVLSVAAYLLYGGTSYGTWGMTPRFLAMAGIIIATMALSEGVILLQRRRRSP